MDENEKQVNLGILRSFLVDYKDLEKLESMATRFNIFESLRIVYNEIRHSNVIAWLCDPNESHGLGSQFIKLFTRRILNDYSFSNISLFDFEGIDFSRVDVIREWNRIDLLITIREQDRVIWIAIENKIGAKEGKKQLENYYKILNQHCKDTQANSPIPIKIVLIPIKLSPDEQDATDSRWFVMGYKQIYETLVELLNVNSYAVRDDVKTFIQHYVQVLKRYILREEQEIPNICKDIYRKHSKALELIWSYRSDIGSEIREFLRAIIDNDKSNRFTKLDSSPRSIDFLTPALKTLFKGKSEHGDIEPPILVYSIIFWYSRNEDGDEFKIVLRLTIQPGKHEIRSYIDNHFRKYAWYAKKKERLYPKWHTVFSKDLISKATYRKLRYTGSDVELGETVKTHVLNNWNNFIDHDFPELEHAVVDYVILIGVAVGDALGFPAQFQPRSERKKCPVVDMGKYLDENGQNRSWGDDLTGLWSDDTSLTLCLAKSLLGGFNLKDQAEKFVAWLDEGYLSAKDKAFDVGMQTTESLAKVRTILQSKNYDQLESLASDVDEQNNGNGSLMRILPLLGYIIGKNVHDQFDLIRKASALTHPHIRSALCCFLYLKMAEYIINDADKYTAFQSACKDTLSLMEHLNCADAEYKALNRLLSCDLAKLPEEEIESGGYVVSSLEASIWCLLTTDSLREALLKAVNLGEDTDTTGAITGGLAALLYGVDSIPSTWIDQLKKPELF